MVSELDIAEALDGITYPASKEHILTYAREKNASRDVIDKLERLDSEYYHSIDEIYNQFGMETCGHIHE